MTVRTFAENRRLALWSLLALASSSACGALLAQEATSENVQLAQLLRQLDLLEHTARESSKLSAASGSRFWFDYTQLHADIARIRAGIQGYLTPQRAQPRDLTPLPAEYRRERVAP